jgi:hypothetical protein
VGDWPQNLEPVPPIIAVGSSACIDEGMTSYNQIGTITGWQYGANVGVFIPFTINRIVTVYKMFYSATTAPSGNVDVGLYDDQGNRIVSMGSTAGAVTNNMQQLDIADTVLLPGTYYQAMACSTNSSGVFRMWIHQSAGANTAPKGQYVMAAALPLPATATFATTTSTWTPLLSSACRVTI